MSSHYEISPREREEEAEWFNRDFSTAELEAEDLEDRIRRGSDTAPQESE